MPEPLIINGTILPPDGVAKEGLQVQAFERDMPSVERRSGLPPPLLGQATTDREGRFQISYSLERLDAASGLANDEGNETSADISFRIFDRAGREMPIRDIDASVRPAGPERILFNAPSPLEARIILAPIEVAAGTSEYELLQAAIAPIVRGIPARDLTADDAEFISDELGLAPDSEQSRHLAILRGSDKLAERTSLPTEAFYGWAREGLPDFWTDMGWLDDPAALADALTRSLDELAATPERDLAERLLRAIDAKIISDRLRARLNGIAHAVRRNSLTERIALFRLEREDTHEPLSGYVVASIDADANDRGLGTDVTNPQGEFSVEFFAEAGPRNLKFEIRGPGLADTVRATYALQSDNESAVVLTIPPPIPTPTLQQIRDGGRIDLPDDTLQALDCTFGVRTLADIRRIGGLVNDPKASLLDSAVVRRLDALADLDRLTENANEADALLQHDYESVLAIADTPISTFVSSLSSSVSVNSENLTDTRVLELHVAAKAQSDLMSLMLAGMVADSANGYDSPRLSKDQQNGR